MNVVAGRKLWTIISLTPHTPYRTPYDVSVLAVVDESAGAGAPANEIEITPDMVEAGLVWLYSYIPDHSDSREFVKNIIKAALANLPPPRQK